MKCAFKQKHTTKYATIQSRFLLSEASMFSLSYFYHKYGVKLKVKRFAFVQSIILTHTLGELLQVEPSQHNISFVVCHSENFLRILRLSKYTQKICYSIVY